MSYVVPAVAAAVEEMAAQAISSGAVVDVAEIAARRRLERETAHVVGHDGGTIGRRGGSDRRRRSSW